MAHVRLVSFGKNQKCTPSFLRPRWRMKLISCKRRMPRFPLADREYFGDEKTVVDFYNNETSTVHFTYDLFSKLLRWVKKEKQSTYTMYVRSENGTTRSVYLVNKIAEFLRSQGQTVEVMHLELSRRKK